ncbi:MAG: hypothetical protein J6W84_02650 [Bacteroidales bacterium]|nr:hypothetical protein [Bacteroidales bacterium]
MKKIIYYSMIGIILMTFASCNKKCKCTTVERDGSEYYETNIVHTLDKDTREEMNISKCSDLNYKESDGSYSIETTCKSTL